MMEWLKKFSCGSGGYGAMLLRLWISVLLCERGFRHFHELTSLFHPKFASLSGVHLIVWTLFEGVGGLLLFFGLFVRLACILALVLALEAVCSHWGGWNGDLQASVAFFVVTLSLLIGGAGECSVDQLIKK